MPNDNTGAAPAQSTLAQLRKPMTPEEQLPTVRAGFNDLQGFELMQRQCRALAASTLVPQQFQNNLPNCLIALEMAQRIGASPLMVMQNLYVVHGRPGWSAKFLIASFNQCGRFSALRFDWSGARDTDAWGCRAWAIEKETQKRIEGPTITMALSKKEGWYEKNGSKWKTIPELMLMYRSAAWLVNTHAPEISMGLNTAEELNDVVDVTRGADGVFSTTTGELQGAQGQEAAAGAGDAGSDAAPITNYDGLKQRLENGTSLDLLDLDADLINRLDEPARGELTGIYKARREVLVNQQQEARPAARGKK